MDRHIFLHGSGLHRSTAYRKVLRLINGFTEVSHFTVIQDRPGFGFSSTTRGRGVAPALAQTILDRRPVGGYTRVFDLASLPGMGPDTMSDILVSAMRLVSFPRIESLTLTFIQIILASPGTDDAPQFAGIQDLDVLLYAKLSGTNGEEWSPLYLQKTDDMGQVRFNQFSEDIAEYAIVAVPEGADNPIYRSGPLLPISELESEVAATLYLIEANENVTESGFNTFLQEQVGLEFDGDKRLTDLSARLRDGYMDLDGEIIVEDAALFGDSEIDFETQVFLGPSARVVSGNDRARVRRSDPSVADLKQLVRVSTIVTSQEHSNRLLQAIGFFGVSIPGVLGFAVPGAILATDNSLDGDSGIQVQLRNAISAQFSNGGFEILERAIREQASTDDDEDEAPGFNSLSFVSIYPDYAGVDQDDPEAIIQFMTRRSSVDSISITPEGITLNAWLVVPYAF